MSVSKKLVIVFVLLLIFLASFIYLVNAISDKESKPIIKTETPIFVPTQTEYNVTSKNITVELTWTKPYVDVDLWITEPTGEMCYYGNLDTAIGGHLDGDDIDLPWGGDEIYTLPDAIDGNYLVQVHYFDDNGYGPADVVVRVTVVDEATLDINETTYTKTIVNNEIWNITIITIPPPLILPPFFNIGVTPTSRIIDPGESTSAIVNFGLIQEPTEPVSLSHSINPDVSSISVSFSPTSCSPTCSSRMSISTFPNTPKGNYEITITGTGRSQRSTTFNLKVGKPTVKINHEASTRDFDPYSNERAEINYEITPPEFFGTVEMKVYDKTGKLVYSESTFLGTNVGKNNLFWSGRYKNRNIVSREKNPYTIEVILKKGQNRLGSDRHEVYIGRPVLLVHGFRSSDAIWDDAEKVLKENGFDVYRVGKVINQNGLEPNDYDIKILSYQLKKAINNVKNYTKSPKVDIVAHSMGGLVARWYTQSRIYRNDVKKLIMISTPNHGSDLANVIRLEYLPGIGKGIYWVLSKIGERLLKEYVNENLIDWLIGKSVEQMQTHSKFLQDLNGHNTDDPIQDKSVNGIQYFAIKGSTANGNDLETISHEHVILKIPTITPFGDGVVAEWSAGYDRAFEVVAPVNFHVGEARDLDVIQNVVIFLKDDPPIQTFSESLNGNVAKAAHASEPFDGTIIETEEKIRFITIDNTTLNARFYLVWDVQNLSLSLTSPSGVIINSSNYDTYPDVNYTRYNFFEKFTIQNPEVGNWTAKIIGINISGSESYILQALFETTLFNTISTDKLVYDTNEPIKITSSINSTDIINLTVYVLKPDNTTENVLLYDDSLHDDENASDSIYGNSFTNTSLRGSYLIVAIAYGTSFTRQAYETIQVDKSPDLTLDSSDISFSNETPTDNDIITINANIKNIGKIDANNATMFFYDGSPVYNGNLIGESDVTTIPVNGSANAFVSWDAEYGSHDIHVVISPFVSFSEENYTNNEAFRTIIVSGTPPTRFTDSYFDYGADTDSDGLYNYLTIEIGINVTTSGNFSIVGELYDNNNNYTELSSNFTTLDSGSQIVQLNFDGLTIYSGGIDGQYNLSYLKLYDGNDTQIDYRAQAYTTSAYNYTSFEKPTANFIDVYSDFGNDVDNNTFYNFLTVEVGVNVTESGNYTLDGTLYDFYGNETAITSNDTYLDAGNQIVVLNFFGPEIYRNGVDGTFNLSVYLYDNNFNLIDNRDQVYTTDSYDHTDFRPMAILTGNYSDFAVDADGNGFYDYLLVRIGVNVSEAGNVFVFGRLVDNSSNEISFSSNTSFLYPNQTELLLSFDGADIFTNGVNGSYYLRDVYVYHEADLSQFDYMYDAFSTSAYNYTDFETKTDFLIWEPDPTPLSGSALIDAFSSLGYKGEITTDLTSVSNLTNFKSVFVLLGVRPNNYVFSLGSTEEALLIDYLNNGGNLYMEGGDVWCFDAEPSMLKYYFHYLTFILCDDGTPDLFNIFGVSGTFTDGMLFEYSGENLYMDHLFPVAPAFTIFTNPNDGAGHGILYNNGTYKTMAASFEFGGLVDSTLPSTKENLLKKIMEYFTDFAPIYSLNSTNSTVAGTMVEHRLRWEDNLGLSGYIFSWQNGANWTQTNESSDLEPGTIQNKGEFGDYTTNFDDGSVPPSGWITGGSVSPAWRSVSPAYVGYGAESNPDVNDNQFVWMKSSNITYGQSGNVSFWWTVSSESGYDYLGFCLDKNYGDTGCTRGSGNAYISGTVNWTQKTLSVPAGSHFFTWYYAKDSSDTYGDDKGTVDEIRFYWTVGADTEANKTYKTYNDVLTGSLLEEIKNITVIVDVSAYSNSGSSNKGNSNPDLWLEMFNGSRWIEIGNMDTTGVGNFSKSIQDPNILNAWLIQYRRDLRIKGRYFDYYSPTLYDEINYTSVRVKIDSTQEFMDDTWQPMTGTGNWSNVTKSINSDIGSIIRWRVYANDTNNNWNFSEYSYVTTEFLDADNPAYFNLTEPADPSTYSSTASYEFSSEWIDNIAVDEVIFEFDGVNYTDLIQAGNRYGKTIGSLPAGTYNYRWYANDTSDNWNSTGSLSFTVLKDSSQVNLLLNSLDGNVSVINGSSVNITAELIKGESSIELYENGLLISSGAPPLSITRVYNTVGIYNITASYPATENYSSSSETHFIDVTDVIPPIVIIVLPKNIVYSTRSIPLNFTVSEQTSWIGYSLDNQPNITITGNTTLYCLSNSTHQLFLYARDASGNTGYSNATFSINTFSGDVTGDCTVDILDLAQFGKAFGSVPSSANWDPYADLNCNNAADVFDLFLIGRNYGNNCKKSMAVGYWKFDEGSGTIAYDSSGNNNYGTLVNEPIWVSGKLGSALDFDGTNDRVQVPDSSLWDFGSGNFTMTAWINTRDKSRLAQRIVSAGYGGLGNDPVTNMWILGFWGNPLRINYAMKYGGYYRDYISDELTYNNNEWAHVAVVKNGSALHFYFNGISAGCNPASYAGYPCSSIQYPSNSNSYLTIGARQGDYLDGHMEFFDGIIDEVKIYNISLSAEEIMAEYAEGFSGSPLTELRIEGISVLNATNLSFDVNVSIDNIDNLYAYSFKVRFDPNVLSAINVVDSFLNKPTWIGSKTIDNNKGEVQLSITSWAGAKPKAGNGTIATITFRVKDFGKTNLNLYGTKLADYYIKTISHSTADGYFSNRLPAIIDIQPNVLNLNDRGKWITTYINLTGNYSFENVSIDRVGLWYRNNRISARSGEVKNNTLIVKFDRNALQTLLSPADKISLTVAGEVYHDSRYVEFEGMDMIRVSSK